MINLCKKGVHSLFNNITSTTTTITSQQKHSIKPASGAGLSILLNYDNIPKPNNVIESSSLIIVSSKVKERVAPGNNPSMKPDRVWDSDGLDSCTEGLGFESYTEKSMNGAIDCYEKTRVKKKAEIGGKKGEKKGMRTREFPPPLKSLNENGKPVFVLKPVRKDGRLELTEVQINRHESLRATRENGRLKMHLVVVKDRNDGGGDDVNVDTKEEDEKVVEDEEWKYPENCSGGDDCRWLNEMVLSHGHGCHRHHHNMHGWGQQCVTIS